MTDSNETESENQGPIVLAGLSEELVVARALTNSLYFGDGSRLKAQIKAIAELEERILNIERHLGRQVRR